MPTEATAKVLFLFRQIVIPWIALGFVSAFLASLAWMAAVTRLDLNYTYPFMSIALLIVMVFSVPYLEEVVTLKRVIGTLFVMLGLVIVARG